MPERQNVFIWLRLARTSEYNVTVMAMHVISAVRSHVLLTICKAIV